MKPQTMAEAKNSKPKTGLEIGDTGTEQFDGIIAEEYNSKLSDTQGISIYDEMRKSDGTVKAVVMATSLPVRRAKWFVQPASDDPRDQEIADFVSTCLFDQMSITWDDFLRQALLSLPLGVMVFEKVFEIRTIDGKERVIWKKFAPRLPKSIQRWQLKNGEDGIEQLKQGGAIAEIPMDKLLVFVNEKEGDNWWGTSILRAAYKHWYIKNNFYKIDAIAFERQGLGIPYAKMPQNYTEADRAKAETILKNIRAHQQAFIIEPYDYEIGFKDMRAGTLRDPQNSIQHHNREIVKCVLAHFLELGSTDSGSRALSEDQSDVFLLALEAVGLNFSDVMNKYAIPQLVDMNYDDVSAYPILTSTGIARVDVEKLATAYSTLVTSGAIKAGEGDEQYFREMLGLPERDTEDDEAVEDEAGDQEVVEEVADELGLSEIFASIKKKQSPSQSSVLSIVKASIRKLPIAHQAALINRNLARLAELPAKYSEPLKHVRAALLAHSQLLAGQFAEGEFTPGRKLTFAEQKVDFDALEDAMDDLEEMFDKDTQALLSAEREKYIAKLTKAVQKGDTEAIKAATLNVQAKYAKIIKEHMKKAYEQGKTAASSEMSLDTPATPQAILDQIEIQSDAIAQMHIAQITNDSKTKLVEALNKGESAASAIATADAAVAAKIAELTTNTSRIVTAGYVNYGRNTAFEANSEAIYALQRSEILDRRTCNYCLSVDGRVIEKTDSFGHNTIFHSGCRGIWVEIMMAESELPPIGGIPKTIRDRFGDAVNDLLQPKTPVTQKDSAARKEAERRAKKKAKKQRS